jgi:tetratricopeptide (TPR) repeat protein
MKKTLLLVCLVLFAISAFAIGEDDIAKQDTNDVKSLNKQALDERLTDPAQTTLLGKKSLQLAQKLNYDSGIAEAYRVTGIGQYYLNQLNQAIASYMSALTYFKKINDLRGEAAVYNNIGNLYRDNDNIRSKEYFDNALVIGTSLSDKLLIAKTYLNMGNLYFRGQSFNRALNYYNQAQAIFTQLKDSIDIIQCSENRGYSYFKLNQLDLAQQTLIDANKKAKEKDLNETVASIDLTLALVYTEKNKFQEAENTLAEGSTYAKIINDDKLEHDFKYTNFQLEYKRKNWKGAVDYLKAVYKQDSVDVKDNLKSQLMLDEVQHKQEEQQSLANLQEKENQYERVRFWGVSSVAGLLLVVVGLLVTNVKRKAKTNSQLTELNAEVLRQKDNLDKVNHHLEEIIDERTKDLQIKNKKLSDYSSYLSHQIRGPIATLKGLLNLEKEGLVDKKECIIMMDKCVSEIDEKIIETSDMMHDIKPI